MTNAAAHIPSRRRPRTPLQWGLVGLGVLTATLLLVVPLALIFAQVASGGLALLRFWCSKGTS